MKYSVSLVYAAGSNITVEADSPEEAAERAYASESASVQLCHQCAHEIELGGCYRAVVCDESGEELLDDGWEQEKIAALTAEVEALRADAERLDWLIKHRGAVVCQNLADDTWYIWFHTSNRFVGVGSKTPREAINRARNGEPE